MMKKVVFIVVLVWTAFPCRGGVIKRLTNPAEVYGWLVAKQGPHGILGNQENEAFGGVYTNALAAICYIHEGDFERARSVFSFFQSRLAIAMESPGGFPQFWDASTGQAHLDSDRWIGDNAWLLIALNHYVYFTRDHTYDNVRETIGDWLIGLQDTDGGILAGYNASGLMNWKSTEGNLDCYAALIDYHSERARLRDFLLSEMWIAAEGRFKMGSTVNESSLDSCSFGVAALGGDFAPALDYAEATMLEQQTCDATGALVKGFSDFVSEERIWLEGTGQMVVAYRIAGRDNSALMYLGELSKATFPSTFYSGTTGLACHTNEPAWATGSTTIFVPSGAWYVFGAWGFNPMAYDYARAVDFNVDGRVDFKDYSTLIGLWGEDESSCPIAPLPVPDGKINAHDLALLGKYWLTDIEQ